MKQKTKFKETEIGKIPEDWKLEKLDSLCEITSSKRIFLKEYVREGIPFYRSKEIILLSQNQKINSPLFISKKRFNEISSKFGTLREGDLLMTSVGTLGIPYVVKANQTFYFKDGNLMWFKSFREKLLNKYLYYWIISPYGKQQFDSIAIGSTQKALTIDSLKSTKISLPSLQEQKAIAKILSDLDSRIELNQQMNKTLEAIGQALFKRWFVDFEFPFDFAQGKPNEEGKPYKSSGGEMADSELGEIPKGWVVSQIGKHLTVKGGTTPSTKKVECWEDGGIPWCTPKDLSRLSSPVLLDTERKITEAGLATISSGLLPAGTLLLSSRAPIGYVAISEIPVSINQGFIAIISEKQISNYFVFFWIKNNLTVIKNMSGGSTFQEINKTSFREIKLILPDSDTLDIFNEILKTIHEKIVINEKESHNLSNIRDSLLPRLMSGRIRVSTNGEVSNGA